MNKYVKRLLSEGVVHGIAAIRARAAAGQPMKSWTYYRHHDLRDSYEPFVQEAHDDRLELLDLLDAADARLPDYEAAVEALERIVAEADTPLPDHGIRAISKSSPVITEARELLARLRETVPA